MFFKNACSKTTLLGCYPAGLQGLCMPSFKTEEPRAQDKDISGLMDGGSYICEVKPWSDTLPHVVEGRQGRAAVFPVREE